MARALQGLTVAELTRELGSRARALATVRWLYSRSPPAETLPEELAGVRRGSWEALVARHGLTVPQQLGRRTGDDGTTKYELAFGDARVETVLVPARARSTVCISSQAGCTRRCVFCATKELGFTRHLQAEEMVAQFLVARAASPPDQPARNVVFMGMGEPMDNLDEVLRAIAVLTQSPAPQLRAEAVTVSTSGVVPGMRRFLAESRASLALSLNATTDAVRERLMPHAKIWPIGSLLEVLRDAARREPKRPTFVEYVLFDGVNDGDDDADRLAAMFRTLPARVNLIPCNPFPAGPLRAPSAERIVAFSRRVLRHGQLCTVRWPRGREIAAACGQLVLAREDSACVAQSPAIGASSSA
jgi:23S rRNA (adenine2503-C2)-methyltransferase